MRWLKQNRFCILVAVVIGLMLGTIASILAGIFGTSHVFGPGLELPYSSIRAQVMNAVISYMIDTSGEPPILEGSPNITITLDSWNQQNVTAKIIDICLIVNKSDNYAYASLRKVPKGCIEIDGPNNDNCDAPNCSGCSPEWNYIWLVDNVGNVYSICVGNVCEANNMDGDQGNFPKEPSQSRLAIWWSDYGIVVIVGVVVFVISSLLTLMVCIERKSKKSNSGTNASNKDIEL